MCLHSPRYQLLAVVSCALQIFSHFSSKKYALLKRNFSSFTVCVFKSILTGTGHNLVLSERLMGCLWNAFGYYLFISSILNKSRNKPCTMSYKVQMVKNNNKLSWRARGKSYTVKYNPNKSE